MMMMPVLMVHPRWSLASTWCFWLRTCGMHWAKVCMMDGGDRALMQNSTAVVISYVDRAFWVAHPPADVLDFVLHTGLSNTAPQLLISMSPCSTKP
jgi:hypothetical protein